ncbi:MAG: hypothetical protein JXB50_13345 [Spirochaetes bacterium]|nr:hypothetical protein [Spirochaetota bacterium]
MKIMKCKNKIINLFVLSLSAFIINCHLTEFYSYDEYIDHNEDEGKVVEMLNGSIESLDKAVYQFASNAGYICKNDASPIAEGTDFFYGDNLDFNIYDLNNCDTNLAEGKYLRITYNKTNIIRSPYSGGLGLIPVARDLSEIDSINSLSPKEGEFFIDPISRKLVLPRPFYWSRCESITNIEAGDIGSAITVFSHGVINSGECDANKLFTESCKFDNGICLENNLNDSGSVSLEIKPDCSNLSTEGSLSLWIKNKGSTIYDENESLKTRFYYNFGDNDYLFFEFEYNYDTPLSIKIKVFLDDNEAGYFTLKEEDYHFLDKVKFIGINYNENTGVKIYINGVCKFSINKSFSSSTTPYIVFNIEKDSFSSSYDASITFVNIKFWNSEINYFAQEYNNGAGDPDVLNNFSILLENLKASYFYFKK